MLNSFVMSVVVVVGKVTLSLFAALALVYYRFPYERAVFMFILLTLLLPVPVRIVPLFRLTTEPGMRNAVIAITVPTASATTEPAPALLPIPAALVETARSTVSARSLPVVGARPDVASRFSSACR